MRAQKPRNDSLINEQLCHGPQKVQLCAKLQLIKYHNDQPDNAEGECIEIHANSLMTPVYASDCSLLGKGRKKDERFNDICFDG